MFSAWPLTGRTEELGLISDTFHAPGTRGVAIAGAAGVGKTRLATDAAATVPRGTRVRWLRATASARTLPLGVFTDIDIVGDTPQGRIRSVIDAIAGGTDRSPPTLLVVDDAHLLDELSAHVVHQVAVRGLATVVLTFRTGERCPDAISALWRGPQLDRLELQPLSAIETRSLLETVLGGHLDASSGQVMWELTRGNPLYLRQLVADELRTGRLAEVEGVWIWSGTPVATAGLIDLIDARMGQLAPPVGTVLDCLAVAEPLGVAVLNRVCGAEAVCRAQTCELITVTADRKTARLAHPLFGDVRRARAGSLALARLRGRIAVVLADEPGGPRNLVRRATLLVESDLEPDRVLLEQAAEAAFALTDPFLAERLVRAALGGGAGRSARLLHCLALGTLEYGPAAETVAALLFRSAAGPAERWQITALRVANMLWVLGRPEEAARLLSEAESDLPDDDARVGHLALIASTAAGLGRPQLAEQIARGVLSSPPRSGLLTMMAVWARVIALTDLGRIAELANVAREGYLLADRAFDASNLRFGLGLLESFGLSLSGRHAEAFRVADGLLDHLLDHPGHATAIVSSALGMVRLHAGRLNEAAGHFREAVARAESQTAPTRIDGARTTSVQVHGFLGLAMVEGMRGHAAAAGDAYRTVPGFWGTDFATWRPMMALARAWVAAAGGEVGAARTIVRDAADDARRAGRVAQEVLLLQTATQFGDPGGDSRLAELERIVEGPRVALAAGWAAAFARHDPDALTDVSARYESAGDLLAAADSSAQAAALYARRGRRGSALTALATARRLADACGRADTPALRAAAQPVPLTSRQREIVTLVARGMTNREIAEKLTLSVRTIEGHLYRAAQKAGVATRGELASVLQGTESSAG
ncbi:LuxR C-terminal-related transcriptional regulator [Rhodococcus sp. NPDC004095]